MALYKTDENGKLVKIAGYGNTKDFATLDTEQTFTAVKTIEGLKDKDGNDLFKTNGNYNYFNNLYKHLFLQSTQRPWLYIGNSNSYVRKEMAFTDDIPSTSDLANKDLSNVTYPANTKGSTTTGSADRVIETYISSDGNTWVRKYASGWKEFGMQFTIGTSGWHTITFPVTFTAYNTYNLNCMAGQTSENTTNFIPNIAGRTVNTIRFVMRYERSNSAGTAAQDCYIYITGRGW